MSEILLCVNSSKFDMKTFFYNIRQDKTDRQEPAYISRSNKRAFSKET